MLDETVMLNPFVVGTATGLKERVHAYQALFGHTPIVEVRGDWYRPFNAEAADYSIHSRNKWFEVTYMGRMWMKIWVGEGDERREEEVRLIEYPYPENLDQTPRGATQIRLRPSHASKWHALDSNGNSIITVMSLPGQVAEVRREIERQLSKNPNRRQYLKRWYDGGGKIYPSEFI